MTEHTTTIAGYRVTVDDDMGDGATGCWIERGQFSASLEAADSVRALVDANDQELPIRQVTLDSIRAWAESKGY